MNLVTSEELKSPALPNQLGNQTVNAERNLSHEEEKKMKDMELIKESVARHKKLLLKLAK